jgi:hypothetical protein
MDPRFGTIVNHDFADYHIPTCADIEDIDAIWLEEPEALPGALIGARSALSAQQPRSPMPPTTRRRPGAEPSADPGCAPVLSLTGAGFRALCGSRSAKRFLNQTTPLPARGSVNDTDRYAGMSTRMSRPARCGDAQVRSRTIRTG